MSVLSTSAAVVYLNAAKEPGERNLSPLDRLRNVAHDACMSNTATAATAEVMAAHINAAPHLTPMVGRDELWPPERVVGIARAERAS